MTNIKQYLDSTYLKTAEQAGISEAENNTIVAAAIQEAIDEDFKLIMIRPEHVSTARKMITTHQSSVLVGTVIDFPEGKSYLEQKLFEAQQAIKDGADDLDFVVDYEAFKNNNLEKVKTEILECTKLGLENNKTVKWIIEIAALNNLQIVQLSALIKNIIISNFKENQYEKVFVKSSTGFYKTEAGKPNGATIEGILLMLENSNPLPVKAAGGVRNYKEAIQIINLGVKRIGTSAAKAIANNQETNTVY